MQTELPSASRSRRFAFPMTAAVLTALCAVGGLVATFSLSFGFSVCNEEPAVVSSHQASLRTGALFVWLTVGAVPLAVARMAHKRHRATWPWVVISGVFVAFALILSSTLTPSTWCLY